MAKIIRLNPLIAHTCKECLQYHTTDMGESFCLAHTIAKKDFPPEWGKHFLTTVRDEGLVYAYLSHPDSIPTWCTLEDYEG